MTWHPTMEADPPEIGAEAMAYQNRLSDAYVRRDNDFCRYTLPGYQTAHSWTYDRYRSKYGQAAEASNLFRCHQLRDDALPMQVRAFAQAGFALSDLYCRTFFRRLALHSNVRRFDHSVVNGVGTLASAIMGLASVGSAATAAVGTAFGTADSAFTSYDATFLVEPDPSLLEQDVLKRQGDVEIQFDTEWRDSTKHLTYYDANKYIERHASYCTFYGMKAIINANLKSDSKTDAKKTDEKANIDLASIETAVRGYVDSLSDKKAKAAARTKFGDLAAALASYVAAGKTDEKANAQVDALSKELEFYKSNKSDAEAKRLDKQIDASLTALKAAK